VLALQSARALGGGMQLPPSFRDEETHDSTGGVTVMASAAHQPVHASNEAYRVDVPSAAVAAEPAQAGPARPPAGGYADYDSYAGYGDGAHADAHASYPHVQQQQYAVAGGRCAVRVAPYLPRGLRCCAAAPVGRMQS
jgi:hypothetical protein